MIIRYDDGWDWMGRYDMIYYIRDEMLGCCIYNVDMMSYAMIRYDGLERRRMA